jgi:hypothetical protein
MPTCEDCGNEFYAGDGAWDDGDYMCGECIARHIADAEYMGGKSESEQKQPMPITSPTKKRATETLYPGEGRNRGNGFRVVIEPSVLEYEPEEERRWSAGQRTGCSDAYCRALPGRKGFGEYLVGRHFESIGYRWVHHDFDLFGMNKTSKYESEEVLLKCFGNEALSAIRASARAMRPLSEAHHVVVEQPDLLLYRPDYSDVRFAECKLQKTADKLNRRQVAGFLLIGAILRRSIDLFVLQERGRRRHLTPIEFRYGGGELEF